MSRTPTGLVEIVYIDNESYLYQNFFDNWTHIVDPFQATFGRTETKARGGGSTIQQGITLLLSIS